MNISRNNKSSLGRMAGPRVVRSGKLGTGASFRELLRSLAKADLELGVLRIISPGDNELRGDIAIASGTHIIGATTNQGTNGWKAIRQLLALYRLEYKYLDYSHISIEKLEQGLSIKVLDIIDRLPELPETAEELCPPCNLHLCRQVDIDQMRADREAEESKLRCIERDFKQFEERSMKWRMLVMWMTFAAASLGALAMYGLCHTP